MKSPLDDAAAIALPLLPIGRWFGFVAPPPLFFVYLLAATAAYLALVEIVKGIFYRFATGFMETTQTP